MVQLYIDDCLAVIAKGTSIQITFQNSYFNKVETVSYDINLPIDDAHNIAIFGVRNHHELQANADTHTATLYLEQKCLRGTVHISKITDEFISVQFCTTVAGIPDDIAEVYIDSEAFGTAVKQTHFPIINADDDLAVGDAVVKIHNMVWEDLGEGEIYDLNKNYGSARNIAINSFESSWVGAPDYNSSHPAVQVNLLEMLVALFAHYGYTLDITLVNNAFFNALYIARALTTTAYHEHLPHWTFAELITEMEIFFGCVVVFDGKNVALKNPNLLPAKTITVVDEFETETGVNESTCNRNVAYDIDQSDNYRLACLDDEIRQKYAQEIEQLGSGWTNVGTRVLSASDDYRHIEYFRPYVVDPNAEVRKCRIVPAAFREYRVPMVDRIANMSGKHWTCDEGDGKFCGFMKPSDKFLPHTLALPVAEGKRINQAMPSLRDVLLDDAEIPDGDLGIMRLIFDSSYDYSLDWDIPAIPEMYEANTPPSFQFEVAVGTEKDPTTGLTFTKYDRPEDVRVLYYMGNATFNKTISLALPNNYYHFWKENEWYDDYFYLRNYFASMKSLSFNRKDGQHSLGRYRGQFQFNQKIVYHKIILSDTLILPSNCFFTINGRRFICKQITVEINDDSIVPLQEGEFYMLDED